MTTLTLGAATLNQTPMDWDGNAANIVAALRAARERRVGILCLPELALTGYGCEDAFLGPGVVAEAEATLGALLPETRGLAVSLGLPILCGGGLYNAVALVVDGAVAGLVAKQHLAGDGIHYEPRWFKPWPAGVVTTVPLLGQAVPLGDLLFDVGGVRVGFEICEDAWVARRPGASLAALGVDVILNPSASHFAFGKQATRQRFVLEGSRAFATNYVYTNHLGNEAGRVIYDGGALIASCGELVASGRRLHYQAMELITAGVDLAATRMARARSASFDVRPAGDPARTITVPFAFPPATPSVPGAAPPAWEASRDLKEEEFTRAVALGLFDYLRKSKARGFVVSSSGGCDSASVAMLAALALRLAHADLGLAAWRERLAHIPGAAAWTSPDQALPAVLTTVYQATHQSTEITRTAARHVATAAASTHLEFDVQPMVDAYLAAAQAGMGRALDWRTDDLALQNIQARVRGPGAWLLANVEGKLLLTTSNRSEAAAGYATMDGDTCGGLAPIAGIDKAFLREWLTWLTCHGWHGGAPVPELEAVIAQRSTPELRPATAHQVSEEDLMPFDILDRIERLGIRDKLPPLAIFQRLRQERPTIDPPVLVGWIERFFTLFARNQWKRERYAPSFHLDDENLDPRSWCRFPILSGGFARELRALRDVLTPTQGGSP
jgi:NAD+ synthase (glutamine-hydrolysing)